MSTHSTTGASTSLSVDTAERYEALLHISEGLCACSEPQELAQVLADQLEGILDFDHLDLLVLKENSPEIEWHAWGKGPVPLGDIPLEEQPIWKVYDRQEPLHIIDLNKDERFPHLKQYAESIGINIGSIVRLPLTTPHRRLGTFGIASRPGVTYSTEDIGFLKLIARVVAFAIDDGLNLKRAQTAQTCLQNQNDRLQLLLNMTSRITSNLELRDLLHAVSANIREVMHCDAVCVLLHDSATDNFILYALDFPNSKGFINEGHTKARKEGDPARQAFDTLKPVIIGKADIAEFDQESREIMAAEGFKNHCLIPLANRGRALGVLGISRTTDDSFTQDDVEFLSQASGPIAVAVENALAFREISELKDKLAQEKLYLEEEIRSEMNFDQIVGNSTALKHVLELVETVAPSDSTVLIFGETGTGKELIARAIHDHSRRKDRTFVRLNCAAIPTGLLESELFGHEKGAFTGAIGAKVGRLELADKGTLFLDEIGDVPIDIQPKLLRALQEREFERLGSTHTKKVNVRLVAATNRDLESMIAAREFRSDLYYRLNVFPIRIPPLRERKEDIPLLASYFVQKFAHQMQKRIETIPTAAMKALIDGDWPGNIREMANFIERAVILTRGRSLEVPVTELTKGNVETPAVSAGIMDREEVIRIVKKTVSEMTISGRRRSPQPENIQREDILRALQETKGRIGGAGGAAAHLGLNRTTLLQRLKRFGIDPKQFS